MLGISKIFSDDVKRAFTDRWPGNVRELENVVEYLVNIVKGDEIRFEYLPSNIRDSVKGYSTKVHSPCNLKDLLDKYERDILESYLKTYGNSTEDKEKIASVLGINLSTLYRKLNKYNLQ